MKRLGIFPVTLLAYPEEYEDEKGNGKADNNEELQPGYTKPAYAAWNRRRTGSYPLTMGDDSILLENAGVDEPWYIPPGDVPTMDDNDDLPEDPMVVLDGVPPPPSAAANVAKSAHKRAISEAVSRAERTNSRGNNDKQDNVTNRPGGRDSPKTRRRSLGESPTGSKDRRAT